VSYTKQTTIWCDECGQWDQISGTVEFARRRLRARGWTRARAEDGTYGDYCPNCSKGKSG